MFEEYRTVSKKTKELDEFDELIDELNKEKSIDDLNIIEITFCLFSIEDGVIKTLLIKNADEPYKGHWILPYKILKNKENVNEALEYIIYENLNLSDVFYDQVCILSNIDAKSDENSIVISYLGLINMLKFKKNLNDKISYEWFPINDIPKMAYQYELVIRETSKKLKNCLMNLKNLKIIFPDSFSLSELQSTYERLLCKNFDRRNFRKKFIKCGFIEETGTINNNKNGRPAKLYKFKDELEDINIF
ncbi:MAG: hypothetical protein NC181_01435 [Clostridium sp.]|nr:hypothetical protein [Clostridium sp.]MCM1444499.1 hypothetical protein [Candidatus Amulumruptor caecigallinarius]